MDRYNQRFYKVKFGDIFQIHNIESVVRCTKQGKLNVGTKLYFLEGESMIFDIDYVCYYQKFPKSAVVINEIQYKSKLKKWFRWFFKHPIDNMKVKYIG